MVTAQVGASDGGFDGYAEGVSEGTDVGAELGTDVVRWLNKLSKLPPEVAAIGSRLAPPGSGRKVCSLSLSADRGARCRFRVRMGSGVV